MDVQIISVPYDSGRRDVRMGAGPAALLDAGLAERLGARGHTATVSVIDPPEPQHATAEIRMAFDLAREIAASVRVALAARRFPLVLAGNCNSALGTMSGLDAGTTGVLWFDAHGDFNTPETSTGGFLDGMALATLAGRCWRPLAASIPGFAPVEERRIILAGARDLDPLEAELLSGTAVTVLSPGLTPTGLEAALDRLARLVPDVYLHLDLDALDPREGRANGFAAADGLTLAELQAAIQASGDRLRIRAASLTAYDPAADANGRAAAAALVLAESIVDAA